MSKDAIQDAYDEKRLAFFTIVPNMADDDLDPYQMRLYLHYRRVCGEHGRCFEGTRTTAAKTKMSTGKVAEARRTLEEMGYIRITDTQRNKTLSIVLVDIWHENVSRYTKCSPGEHGVHDVNTTIVERSSGEHGVHDVNESISSDQESPDIEPSEENARARAGTAAQNEIQETPSAEEVTAPAGTGALAIPDAPEPIPGAAAPLPAQTGTDVPPAVLNGLGMPGAANVSRQERQAKDYRAVQKHPLYVAFAQAWADSLPGKSAAEREALIPQLRPDNALRHLNAIRQLELMKATPDHVRTVVSAKREAGKSEYPFAWLPDDVQKQIVAETDVGVGGSDCPPVAETPVVGPRIREISETDRTRYASVLGERPTLPGVKAGAR